MSARNSHGLLPSAAVAALLAIVFATRPAHAEDPKSDDDPVFRAIESELERAKSLSMPDVDKPYFLKAHVTDTSSFHVSASFGAVTARGGGRDASLSTDVRVGSADFDNTNFSGDFSFSFGGGGGAAPLERDFDALRQALWLGLDSNYKAATESIAKKRAYLSANSVPDRLPDLAPATTTDLVLPRQELAVDKTRWQETVRRVSAVFRAHPIVYSCDASLSASISHQYFVSTDPTKHRFSYPSATFSISAATQASDGMDLSVSYEAKGRTEADLPAEPTLIAKAEELATLLDALAKAPTAEDYAGPVLFTGDAAASFFLETVGSPLSNPRQDLGSDRGGRLIDRLGRRIAARGLTARDDPTKTEWNGRPLLGYFPVDDEGVLPEPITLIENGVLKSYYMNRAPTKLIAKSNGHARGSQASVGNLFIEVRDGVGRDVLEKRMIDMCREDDLEYGLVVEDLSEGSGYWYGGRGGDIQLSSPTVAYRLYRDGHRVLIRGASFKSAANRILKDIVAFGDEPVLLNTRQFGQSVSVIAPSVLVEELEVRRPTQENSKPPSSGRPELGDRGPATK